MACLEQRKGNYRVVFRLNGRKFSRSLRTDNEKAATANLARLEDNLRRVELGTLEIPPDADIATFLLSDGKQARRIELPPVTRLNELFDRFFASLPEGNLEQSTITTMEIHRRHLERHLGASARVESLSRDDLQAYISARTKEAGRRGRPVQPRTIRKEIATLRALWQWSNIEGSFPRDSLRFPKDAEKAPFQTWAEIERHIKTGNIVPLGVLDGTGRSWMASDEEVSVIAHSAARYEILRPKPDTTEIKERLKQCKVEISAAVADGHAGRKRLEITFTNKSDMAIRLVGAKLEWEYDPPRWHPNRSGAPRVAQAGGSLNLACDADLASPVKPGDTALFYVHDSVAGMLVETIVGDVKDEGIRIVVGTDVELGWTATEEEIPATVREMAQHIVDELNRP